MMTPERLKELSNGYDLDGGGYEFENAPKALGGAVVVWGDPDLDYLGLQDEDGDCDLFAFAPNSGHFTRHEFPKSFKDDEGSRYVRVNQGDLYPSEHLCNCHGRVDWWTGAAGEPQEPIPSEKLLAWIAEGKVELDADGVGENKRQRYYWEFTGDFNGKPYPDCDRCGGDGTLDSPGGEWAFYRLLWDEE